MGTLGSLRVSLGETISSRSLAARICVRYNNIRYNPFSPLLFRSFMCLFRKTSYKRFTQRHYFWHRCDCRLWGWVFLCLAKRPPLTYWERARLENRSCHLVHLKARKDWLQEQARKYQWGIKGTLATAFFLTLWESEEAARQGLPMIFYKCKQCLL